MSRPPVIHAANLRFAYPSLSPPRPAQPVLDHLSLSLETGECLALMGANGAGKTTLCRAVSALAPQLTGGELTGRLEVLGQEVAQVTAAALAGRVGLTFQDVEHQLFNPTVEAEVAWGLEALGLAPAEIADRLRWALHVVGLNVALSRSPAYLSGGQQRRLALAVALAPRPELLVLDEPVSGLDPAGRREVLAALATLRQETNAAILMAESDPEAILALADRVAILADGRVALEGAPREVVCQVERLQAMGVAAPQLAHLAHQLNARLGTRLCFVALPEAEETLRAQLQPNPRWRPDPEPAARPASDAALRFDGVSFGYPEGPPVLHQIELSVPAGQFVALVGANGSGKTTLSKQIIGLLRPTAGRVWVGGQDATPLSVGRLAQQVGYLFQHPERQIFAATVRDEVAFGPRNLGLEPDEVDRRVAAALARFGLSHLAATPPAVLSYALRRLVTLASVAAMEPQILVLDEPTVGLDAPGRQAALDWASECHAAGRTIWLVTHDMPAAAQAERVIVLDDGRVLADAPPAQLFRQPDILARAALEPPPVAALAAALGLPAGVLDVTAFVAATQPAP